MYNQIRNFAKKNYKIKNLYRKLIKADIIEKKFIEMEKKVIYNYIFNLEQRIKAIESQLNIPSKSINILSENSPEPTLEHPISQVATSNQLNGPIFSKWCDRLRLPNYPNRKTWEFVYICEVLEQNSLIAPHIKGVGFGVGKDPIVAYFVKNKMQILATDLDISKAKENGWVHTNQFSKNILDLNEKGIVSDSELRSHVNLQAVDMNHIPDNIKGYDFTWSACAFEHLGSIEKGLEFVKNSLKCLKPGGIAIHTTEYNVSSNDETVDNTGTVLFRKKDIEKLINELKKEGHEVEVNFNTGTSNFDKYFDIPPYSDYTHLKLLIDKYVSTSIGIMIKKAY